MEELEVIIIVWIVDTIIVIVIKMVFHLMEAEVGLKGDKYLEVLKFKMLINIILLIIHNLITHSFHIFIE